jgi:hypothetical protein
MRRRETTIPAGPLPSTRDPIWRLGRDIVEMLLDYMEGK